MYKGRKYTFVVSILVLIIVDLMNHRGVRTLPDSLVPAGLGLAYTW